MTTPCAADAAALAEAYALAWPPPKVARTHSCLVRFARLLWSTMLDLLTNRCSRSKYDDFFAGKAMPSLRARVGGFRTAV